MELISRGKFAKKVGIIYNLIQIIKVFANRLNGQHFKKTKKESLLSKKQKSENILTMC